MDVYGVCVCVSPAPQNVSQCQGQARQPEKVPRMGGVHQECPIWRSLGSVELLETDGSKNRGSGQNLWMLKSWGCQWHFNHELPILGTPWDTKNGRELPWSIFSVNFVLTCPKDINSLALQGLLLLGGCSPLQFHKALNQFKCNWTTGIPSILFANELPIKYESSAR